MNHSEDDYYQDGIKLPMKDDKLEWETIHDNHNSETSRLKIYGGYLYKHRRFFKSSIDCDNRDWVQDFYMVFVPDAPNSQVNVSQDGESDKGLALEFTKLRDHVAEISVRLHKMESSLREFEKQKVDPLHQLNLKRLEEMTLMARRLTELEVRMTEYEKMEWTSQPLNNLAAQYCNLSSLVKDMRDELNVVNKRIENIESSTKNDLDPINLMQRIGCLENGMNSYQLRINKLESLAGEY